MKNAELLKRIETLEQRVRDLEARPILQPVYIPQPYPVYPAPVYPSYPTFYPPSYPPTYLPTIWCGNAVGIAPSIT